jgi:hypothetical protein
MKSVSQPERSAAGRKDLLFAGAFARFRTAPNAIRHPGTASGMAGWSHASSSGSINLYLLSGIGKDRFLRQSLALVQCDIAFHRNHVEQRAAAADGTGNGAVLVAVISRQIEIGMYFAIHRSGFN